MFAAQRPSRADAFRLLCINRAHEDESGLANIDIQGLRPLDILPPDEAEAVESRYALCVRKREVIQYDETLHLRERPSRWRTILHPVRMKSGQERVIGTSFPLGPEASEPVGVLELGAALAVERSKFGPVSYLLREAPPQPERRIIRAEAMFGVPKVRDIAQRSAPSVANPPPPLDEKIKV